MSTSYNPFDKWKGGWIPRQPSVQNINPGTNISSLQDPVVSAPPVRQEEIDQGDKPTSVPVSLPPHLYVPEGAQTIDITRVCEVLPGTDKEILMSFTAPDGVITNFIQYGIFNEGEEADLFEFIPEVDNSRVFPFHGDPMNNFKIAIGTGPDLSNVSLKNAYLQLQPFSVMQWRVTNQSTVARVMGVRMVGYLLNNQVRTVTRFGG